MKVLVVGSGGREHALAWKISQSKYVGEIYCAPGNAGTSEIAKNVPIKVDDLNALLDFAKEKKIDLTVVGPELPLALGIVDLFEQNGLKIFGPKRSSAEIESSKVFAKNFMRKYGIPTASFEVYSKDEVEIARKYARLIMSPLVFKADGLAGGKGVTICKTTEEKLKAVDDYLVKGIFGKAGEKIVVEDYLSGEEASVFVITDGKDYILLPPAQDYKRAYDNDEGKNTGGMGSYAPTPLVNDKLLDEIKKKIVEPTLDALNREKRPYRGCLYLGLMITENGPMVLEYNCRFGDPETQVVLPLLDCDIVEMFIRTIDGELKGFDPKISDRNAVCVIMASAGYPDSFETDKEIFGLDEVKKMDDVIVFHSGTKKVGEKVLTAGGRVLGVTAIGSGKDFMKTIERVYSAVEKIKFEGAHYRRDIGLKFRRYISN